MTREAYIVFGGAGFLGCHLSEALLRAGYDVLVFDNLSTGRESNLIESREIATQSGTVLSFHEIDVCSDFMRTKVRRCLEGRKLHGIANLACPASPVAYQQDPIGTLDVCYLGTRNALEIARDHECRVLHASTSEVYGDPDAAHHPQREDYWGNVNPFGERSMYDEGKRVAEALCRSFLKKGTDVRLVRIFNCYGDRMAMDDGRVVSEFIVRALRGEDLRVHGGGTQTRSLCHVSDMIEGFMRVLSLPTAPDGPINLGNPEELSVLSIAHLVQELTHSRSNVIVTPAVADDPKQRCPNIDLAERQLDWRPTVSARDGISATIEWFRNVLRQMDVSPRTITVA